MSDLPSQDPVTAILIAVTEIRGSIRSALERLERHQFQLDAHSVTLTDHGERIVALESHQVADSANDSRMFTARSVLWTAIGVGVSLISTLMAIFLAIRGG
jgi:hypothetical protein